MKHLFLYFSLLVSFINYSQGSLNDYEMALIPTKFEFQTTDNQYRINTTIKAFLKQKGFEAYVSNEELPEGFLDYNCNKVFVNVVPENTLFVTKLKIEFKDCKNKILFTTDLGESRTKDLPQAYNQALLMALKSFDKAKYKFSGKTYYDQEAQEKIKSRDVENISTEVTKVIKTEKNVTYEKTSQNDKPIKNSPYFKVIIPSTKEELILYKTSRSAIYIGIKNETEGVVFSKKDLWYFEYLEDGLIVSEYLDIKL